MKRSRMQVDPEKVRAWQRRSAEKAQKHRQERAVAASRPKRSPLARSPVPGSPKAEEAIIAAEKKRERRIELPERPAPVEGPLAPLEWRETVWALDRGRCIICNREVPRDADLWVWQAHHFLPKGRLRREGLHAYVWDPRNGGTLCRRDHERHESRTRSIRGDSLPERSVEFAREVAPWGLDLLYRLHPMDPAAGISRTPRREQDDG